jgi:hypothetical protein
MNTIETVLNILAQAGYVHCRSKSSRRVIGNREYLISTKYSQRDCDLISIDKTDNDRYNIEIMEFKPESTGEEAPELERDDISGEELITIVSERFLNNK